MTTAVPTPALIAPHPGCPAPGAGAIYGRVVTVHRNSIGEACTRGRGTARPAPVTPSTLT